MAYTVKQLAKISGVSARTLRFYDEIGLLKPAYYGENHYRYYEKEQLLILQQILFFRELGFPLNDIQSIVCANDFDKIEALQTHQSVLLKRLEKTETLLKTIDKTISHLRGKLIMNDSEMYDGFDPKKQQEHEQYMIDAGLLTQEDIHQSWKKARHWNKSNWEAFKQEGETLNQALANAVRNKLKYDDVEVQALIQKHYEWVQNFWTPTQDTYNGLAKMYLDHPDFRAFYNRYHPELVEFLVEAMRFYAKQKLV